MEYTDCDNCHWLEVENADLIVANDILREELEDLREQVRNIVDSLSEI